MNANREESITKTLCYLLRHNPSAAQLEMDKHGYVDIDHLISNLKEYRNMNITKDILITIVCNDNGRFYIKGNKIKCSSGHSLDWIVPEEMAKPTEVAFTDFPKVLYYGTTLESYQYIENDGKIRMRRGYVHLSSNFEYAENAAKKHKKDYVVLEINVVGLVNSGFKLYISENGIYMADEIPTDFISAVINLKYNEDNEDVNKYIYFETYSKNLIDNFKIVELAKLVHGTRIDAFDLDTIREYAKSCKGIKREVKNPSISLILRNSNRSKAAQIFNRRHPEISFKDCMDLIERIINNEFVYGEE